MKRKSNWLNFALGVLLALGAATAWALAGGVPSTLISLVTTARGFAPNLMITDDGQALVVTSDPFGYDDAYRNLDGEPVTPDGNKPFTHNPYSAQLMSDTPTFHVDWSWATQIAGFAARRFDAFWYLVDDPDHHGHSYFIGYDARGRNLLGYLGSKGFRPDLPPLEERFVTPARGYPWGTFASRSNWRHGGEPYSATPPGGTIVYVISNHDVLRVDLDQQTVRKLDLPSRAVSLAMINMSRSGQNDQGDEQDAPQRLVARLDDAVLVLDEDGKQLRRIAIPAPARDKPLMVYLTTGPKVVLTTNFQQRSHDAQIYWLEEGQAEPVEHRVWVPPAGNPSNRWDDWLMPVFMPVPAFWISAATFAEPTRDQVTGEVPSGPWLMHNLREYWPALLILVAVSSILAAWCYRRQVRFGQPWPVAWALLVLLLGPPGLAGYLLHRRWPPRLPCKRCEVSVPRDRNSCLACAEAFEPPPPLGVEVFA